MNRSASKTRSNDYDSANTLMLVGSDDQDMARCAHLLLETGGGMAIVNRGEILEKIRIPLR
jgi:adenine deaminase